MTSLAIQADVSGIERLGRRIARLADFGSGGASLMHAIGAEVAGQLRRRIEEAPIPPQGTARRAASTYGAPTGGVPSYGVPGHGADDSMLVGEGELGDTVQYVIQGNVIAIGGGLAHVTAGRLGGRAAPGLSPALSPDNMADLSALLDGLPAVVDDWVDGWVDRVLEAL